MVEVVMKLIFRCQSTRSSLCLVLVAGESALVFSSLAQGHQTIFVVVLVVVVMVVVVVVSTGRGVDQVAVTCGQ